MSVLCCPLGEADVRCDGAIVAVDSDVGVQSITD
jgi:hypothetical protein